MKSYKVGVTEGLTTLLNYVNTNPHIVYYQDLVQFAIDYDCFIDLYMNLQIFDRLVLEHNKKLLSKTK